MVKTFTMKSISFSCVTVSYQLHVHGRPLSFASWGNPLSGPVLLVLDPQVPRWSTNSVSTNRSPRVQDPPSLTRWYGSDDGSMKVRPPPQRNAFHQVLHQVPPSGCEFYTLEQDLINWSVKHGGQVHYSRQSRTIRIPLDPHFQESSLSWVVKSFEKPPKGADSSHLHLSLFKLLGDCSSSTDSTRYVSRGEDWIHTVYGQDVGNKIEDRIHYRITDLWWLRSLHHDDDT